MKTILPMPVLESTSCHLGSFPAQIALREEIAATEPLIPATNNIFMPGNWDAK